MVVQQWRPAHNGDIGLRVSIGVGYASAMKMVSAIACVALMVLATRVTPSADQLKVSDLTDEKGDGPDGKGNTEDDTWGFWFELAHAPGTFRRLTRHSSTVPKKGIPRKVTGPVASLLPNPGDTKGWILHTDWDGRFEGVWGDKKAGAILAHPYVEKSAHQAVAITYKIPQDGVYVISGGITDVQVKPDYPKHDGVIWKIEVLDDASDKQVELAKGEPVGDGHGRPDSAKFKTRKTRLKKGNLVRLVIHPNKWWGQDLTRIDALRIEGQSETQK